MNFSHTSFGPITVVPGESGSTFPFCTSIFINDDARVLIDPGAGPGPLEKLKAETHVDIVVNTHYHFDHIAYNYLFDDAKIFINEREGGCFRKRQTIGLLLGLSEVYGDEWVDGWVERISNPDTKPSPYSPQNNHKWWLSSARIDGTYAWGETFNFGRVTMQMIGAPGHSHGFSCPYFPDYGLVYTADMDLTDFGPWYGGSDGDIDAFIESARKIAGLDAEIFVTGHEKGIVKKGEFTEGLATFLEKIGKRDEKILARLTEARTLDELSDMGLIYKKKFLVDDWIYMWNKIMMKKHLQRLVKHGAVLKKGERYIAAR
jgi:hydroxyacylglutathione hydrolase